MKSGICARPGAARRNSASATIPSKGATSSRRRLMWTTRGVTGAWRRATVRRSRSVGHEPAVDHAHQQRRTSVPMNRYEFELHLSPARYLDYYRGKVRHVVVRCASGQNVQFPASLVQRFVSPEGIHGNFVLTCDEKNKCIGLERLPTGVRSHVERLEVCPPMQGQAAPPLD